MLSPRNTTGSEKDMLDGWKILMYGDRMWPGGIQQDNSHP